MLFLVVKIMIPFTSISKFILNNIQANTQPHFNKNENTLPYFQVLYLSLLYWTFVDFTQFHSVVSLIQLIFDFGIFYSYPLIYHKMSNLYKKPNKSPEISNINTEIISTVITI